MKTIYIKKEHEIKKKKLKKLRQKTSITFNIPSRKNQN